MYDVTDMLRMHSRTWITAELGGEGWDLKRLAIYLMIMRVIYILLESNAYCVQL
jgi:hypothetical protein